MPCSRRLVAALVAACALGVAGCAEEGAAPRGLPADAERCEDPADPGRSTHSVRVDGRERRYVLDVPRVDDTAQTARPLVVLLHGIGGTPRHVLAASGFDELAEREDVVLVAPQGRGRVSGWDFRGDGDSPGADVDTVRRIVEEVRSAVCVDADRIYAAGFSNGSALTLAMACEPGLPLAAFAGVSAPYVSPRCDGDPPVPVIYLHGRADEVIGFDGGDTPIGPMPSVEQMLRRWAERDGCTPAPRVERVSENVERRSWDGCDDGAAVLAYTVDDGGHQWPGGDPGDFSPHAGKLTREIDATRLIWEFFAAHPRT